MSDIETAERVISELEAKRTTLLARRAGLDDERQRLAYIAHAQQDVEAYPHDMHPTHYR